jgi:hypothetical protein
MRILPPFEDKIRHSIRDELAKKPTITMTALKEQLETEYGRDFHFSYLRKLVGKVRNEINYEIDTAKIEPRIAELRENYRVMREAGRGAGAGNPLRAVAAGDAGGHCGGLGSRRSSSAGGR